MSVPNHRETSLQVEPFRVLSSKTSRVICPGELARFLVEVVIPENPKGWTVDPCAMTYPDFKPDDYVVSLRGHEERLRGRPSESEVLSWIESKSQLLQDPTTYVGGWLNFRIARFCLDVSIIVTGRATALSVARANSQDAIYHPSTDEDITVPYPAVA